MFPNTLLKYALCNILYALIICCQALKKYTYVDVLTNILNCNFNCVEVKIC